ncbi:MAG TPA: hypothetical protein VHP83_23820, partial [Aggregatilineaceae bacterium]|nr:hypothetical protein [Aggregatilineaceae bacterium]
MNCTTLVSPLIPNLWVMFRGCNPDSPSKFTIEVSRSMVMTVPNICAILFVSPNIALYQLLKTNDFFKGGVSFQTKFYKTPTLQNFPGSKR